MPDKNKPKALMAAATEPTTANRTGAWRFGKPVFVEQIAPCREACPVGEDIPSIMALIEAGAFGDAYKRILLENPFPGICGKLCFHPCEKVCNRRRFDQSVSIRDLEYFLSNVARESKQEIEKPKSTQAPKVAVVGTGPAGLSCAYFLARLGYLVTIFEKNFQLEIYTLAQTESKVSLRKLECEIEQVISLDINLCLNVSLPQNIYQDLADEFDAIYISSGSERIGHSPLRNSIDEIKTTRVALSSGAKRTQAVMLSWARESNAKVIYPDPSSVKRAADLRKKDGNLSKYIVREIASGKLSAMVIDISFHNSALESIQQFVLGRLGALSFESYQHGRDSNPLQRTEHVVRFADLNTTSYQKSNRIQPLQPNGLYSKRQAVQSARRCFKCGICTYCYKCYDYCPDLSVYMDAKYKYREINYDHCKGCGICAAECPRAAIGWTKE